MKKISIYLKSDCNAAVTYYRFYQYFSKIREVDVTYRYMIPSKYNERFLPISKQPFVKRVFIFIFSYVRVLVSLFHDLLFCPDVLIISRRLIMKCFPFSYILLIKVLKIKGVRIIYDFDDSVVEYGEIPKYGFNFLIKNCELIIVASNVLKDRIPYKYRAKVMYLPTTDGDIYKKVSVDILKMRRDSFDKEINLIWVGTFPGLEHLNKIVEPIELFGEHLKQLGKQLNFIVVCDYQLVYNSKNFNLVNIKWKRNIAVNKLLEAHIGIMPLRNVYDLSGKGGFKLIQYLSAGLPVVGSAVGINKEIITPDVGKLVEEYDTDEWLASLNAIVENKQRWLNYSENAYKRWNDEFNYNYNLSVWTNILMQ